MIDLEEVLGHGVSVGEGGAQEQEDGTWLAWAALCEGDEGMYGRGASEGHAIEALSAKLKALGGVMAAAFAEAESRHRMQKSKDNALLADKLEGLLKDLMEDRNETIVAPKKKPEGDN